MIKHSDMSLYTSGEETKGGKRLYLLAMAWNMEGMSSRSDVLWQPGLWVMKLILEGRERRSGKCVTFITHHPLFPHFQPLSLCSARREAEKKKKKKKRVRAFCVNSLIRKTLTSIVPLHFGGKIFHWFFFCSNRRRAELRGALCGITLCGGFSGTGGETARCECVCASVRRWMVR